MNLASDLNAIGRMPRFRASATEMMTKPDSLASLSFSACFCEVVAPDDERGGERYPRGFLRFVLVDDITQLVDLLGVSLQARADPGWSPATAMFLPCLSAWNAT